VKFTDDQAMVANNNAGPQRIIDNQTNIEKIWNEDQSEENRRDEDKQKEKKQNNKQHN